MAKFILLLRDDPTDFAGLSPEEMQRIIDKYRAWGEPLRRSGTLLLGHKLEDGSGRLLQSGGGGQARVLDGPYSETKEVVGGLYAIEAPTWEAAVAIARTSPHLEFGSIEIRQVEET